MTDNDQLRELLEKVEKELGELRHDFDEFIVANGFYADQEQRQIAEAEEPEGRGPGMPWVRMPDGTTRYFNPEAAIETYRDKAGTVLLLSERKHWIVADSETEDVCPYRCITGDEALLFLAVIDPDAAVKVFGERALKHKL